MRKVGEKHASAWGRLAVWLAIQPAVPIGKFYQITRQWRLRAAGPTRFMFGGSYVVQLQTEKNSVARQVAQSGGKRIDKWGSRCRV